jgi:hypothetical protein
VGSNTQKYYRVVRAGTVALSSDLLRSDVTGKFDLNARLGQYNLVSLPLISSGAGINAVIGGQLNQEALEFSADMIFYPNATGGFDIAWLKSDGQWYTAGSETELSPITLDPNKSFYISNSDMPGHAQKYVTIVGNIESSASRSQSVTQLYNMVGSPYPTSVTLNRTGLFESGLKSGAFEFAASQVYSPNATGGFDIAWLKADGRWYDSGSDTTESSIRLRPNGILSLQHGYRESSHQF